MSGRDAFLDTFDAYIRAKFDVVTLQREQMHGFQVQALNFLKLNPFSALFIDMGLGKTIIGGTLVVDLLAEMDNDDPVLIIGPLKVATCTWPDEFRNWQHLAAYNVEVIHVSDDDPALKAAGAAARDEARRQQLFPSEVAKAGTASEARMREKLRAAKATSKRQVHIISRDWVEWLVNFYGRKWPYRTVLIDESSGFKSHSSKRFEALQAIREVPGLITRLHLFTASPAAESLLGLFPQIFLLDKGKRLGRNITAFRNRFFTQNRYTQKWEARPGAEKEIMARIADLCVVMKEDDYLPRVKAQIIERYVDMTPAQMKLYMTMEKDMLVKLDDDTVVEAETAAALSAKLLQMASGVLYDTKLEPGQDEDDDLVKVLKVHHIHDHKIEMLKEIIESAGDKNILVAYHHKSSKERLKKHFKNIVIMDKDGKAVDKWKKGKIKLMGMHPASGGHGLNLQSGGHIIVFFDIIWSLELYEQFIGRLDRQGQKSRVLVYLLICRNTLDQAVVGALRSKNDAQGMLMRILRKMRKKLKRLLKTRKDLAWEEVVEILEDIEDDAPVVKADDDEL